MNYRELEELEKLADQPEEEELPEGTLYTVSGKPVDPQIANKGSYEL